MKKILSVIFVIISTFSFFILYSGEQIKNTERVINWELNLENNYRIIMPNEIKSKNPKQVIEILKKTLDDYGANIYYSRLEEFKDNNEKNINYVYFNNLNYFNNLKFSNGRGFSLNEKNSDNFLSTEKTNNPKQIGQIASFGEKTNLEVYTLSKLLEEKLPLNGYYYVQLNKGEDINSFINDLEKNLNIKGITVNEIKNESYGSYFSQEWYIVLALYFLALLTILYDILKSYKKIGVEKMLGFSKTSIWLNKVKEIVVIQIIVQVIVTVVLSMMKFKYYNYYVEKFLIQLFFVYLIELIVLFIAISIPYLYIYRIKISDMIKNKQPNKAIIIFNSTIKSILIIVFFVILNFSVSNFKELKKVYEVNYGKWAETKDYAMITDYDNLPQGEIDEKKDKEMYTYFNKKGAIFADFTEFEPFTRKIRLEEGKAPYKTDNIWVNPNYLEKNKVYDVNGNEVKISEEEKETVVLIPDKYKSLEKDIIEYYKYQNKGSMDLMKQQQKIKIIWIKSGQNLFSYTLDINPEKGNMVKDSFINVVTENNGDRSEFNRATFGSHPLMIKLNDTMSIDDNIIPELKELGYYEYDPHIQRVSDIVAVESKKITDVMKLVFITIIILSLSIIMIIIQNIYTYFKHYKVYLAIKHFLGYGIFNKFKGYFLLIFINWLVIFMIIRIFNLMNLKLQIIVSLIFIAIELLLSLLILSIINKRNITTILKRR